jgi:hypothetical protein
MTNVKGPTWTSLITVALIFSLAYAPALCWLRKQLGGCRPAVLFPLASAVVLNLPGFRSHFWQLAELWRLPKRLLLSARLF